MGHDLRAVEPYHSENKFLHYRIVFATGSTSVLVTMDIEEDWSGQEEADDHSRTIVHLDLDCFYAQVEEVANPSLKGKPLGVRQKQIVVTCNYAARARGVTKCMFLKDALDVCPELELRCGEDLAKYRRYSAAVTATLAASGCPVERLGMDENWVDVSKLVSERLGKEKFVAKVEGNVIGGTFDCSVQGCGCDERLQVLPLFLFCKTVWILCDWIAGRKRYCCRTCQHCVGSAQPHL